MREQARITGIRIALIALAGIGIGLAAGTGWAVMMDVLRPAADWKWPGFWFGAAFAFAFWTLTYVLVARFPAVKHPDVISPRPGDRVVLRHSDPVLGEMTGVVIDHAAMDGSRVYVAWDDAGAEWVETSVLRSAGTPDD